ncbi:MAG: hypothetical protein JW807_15390 [Spirochaetes bacterium]|nr:hypothetical protein [Spirochaetota bacterium]
MKRLSLICITVIVLSMPVLGAKKLTIAILDFLPRDVAASEALKISELIRNEMVNSNQYIVLERTQMDKILKEQGFQMTGCTEVNCAVQAGRLLSARKILVGTVMHFGGNIAVTGRIVDVDKGIAEFAEKERALSKEDEFYMIERFCDKLTYRITGTHMYEPEPVQNLSPSRRYNVSSYKPLKDPFAWMSLGAGLVSGTLFIYGNIKYCNLKKEIAQLNKQMIFIPNIGAGDIIWIGGSTFILDKSLKKPRLKEDEAKRNTYNTAAGVTGGFALISFLTFAGQYINNSPAYEPIKDPFAWFSLGSGLISAIVFSVASIQNDYTSGLRKVKNKFMINSFIYYDYQIGFDPLERDRLWSIDSLLFEKTSISYRLKKAEKQNNTSYIIGGTFGGLALVSFLTFIGRYVTNTSVAKLFHTRNDMALFLPPQYINLFDLTKRNRFGFGIGLSVKL